MAVHEGHGAGATACGWTRGWTSGAIRTGPPTPRPGISSSLNDRFGSLYLAAAAYNAGAGKVSRGVRRLPDDDDADSLNSDATFFRLYDTKLLRRETKDYVPKLIAAARIAKEPARYGFHIDAGRAVDLRLDRRARP